jgi:hypothetical protein
MRPYALTMILSSAAMTAVGIGTAVYPPLQDRHGSLFGPSGAVLSAGHLGVLVAVAALALSGAAGRGWLARVSFAVALCGFALLTAAEALLRIAFDAGNSLFGVASPLCALGMILVGIAVIRAGRWSSWRRFSPLVCGAYIPLVLIPSFAIAKGPSFIALAGWSLTFVALGFAMNTEDS